VAVDQAALNALTLQWGRTKADLDDQENRYRINYNNVLDKMKGTYEDTALRGREASADRGLTHAGPTMKAQMDLSTEFNKQGAQAAQDMNTNLATIARRRLEQDQDFENKKLLAGLGYGLQL
jgi:hypothetical protein